jgi:diguanylate cyclase (GGDEF)-like protein
VAAIVLLVGASAYLTVVQPNFGVRFLISSWGSAAFYLLTARILARGGLQAFPVRYLVALSAAVHGVFLLLRPLVFRLADALAPGADIVLALPQLIVLESIVALVLIGFGILMLTNEFTTSALRRLAEMDSLTSVFNRRAFLTLLDKALSQARRTESELHVLVIDLDHFKRINDTWGHKCGDDVLRHFVGLAASCLRMEDVMGRLGGEEFAIVLPSANAAGAAAVAERLRALVASQPAMTEHGPITLTVSVGVTQCAVDESSETALQRADQAMYRAKELGRNQVHLKQAPTAVAAG